MRRRIYPTPALILAIALAVSGCQFPGERGLSPPEQTQVAESANATLTARAWETLAARPTETASPTAAPSLTPTPQPSPTETEIPPTDEPETAPGTGAERITFAAGATQFETTGTTSLADRKEYVLKVGKDQLLDVRVDSLDPVALSIHGEDGTVLVSPMGEVTHFRGVLPATQDYFIAVRTTAETTTFSLRIMIPVRIAFDPGENHFVTEAPAIPDGMNRQYSLYALAGQTLEVAVEPAGDFALTIYAIDGRILMGSHDFGSEYAGELPVDTYYIISVSAAPGTTSGYTLTMTVE